jgi:hypothetical protein
VRRAIARVGSQPGRRRRLCAGAVGVGIGVEVIDPSPSEAGPASGAGWSGGADPSGGACCTSLPRRSVSMRSIRRPAGEVTFAVDRSFPED